MIDPKNIGYGVIVGVAILVIIMMVMM